jgi:hypothetical protein
MGGQQGLQHATTHWRQPFLARGTERFGMRNGGTRAALVIVIGPGKYR